MTERQIPDTTCALFIGWPCSALNTGGGAQNRATSPLHRMEPAEVVNLFRILPFGGFPEMFHWDEIPGQAQDFYVSFLAWDLQEVLERLGRGTSGFFSWTCCRER